MVDTVVGVIIIVFCMTAVTVLVVYSRRRIERIGRMKRTTYRDIIGDRRG